MIGILWKSPKGCRGLKWLITTIVHGSKDDVVSLSVSETVSSISEIVELVVIDDGHRMKVSSKIRGLVSDLMSR